MIINSPIIGKEEAVGDAATSDVLDGKTFSSENAGVGQTGDMTNQGSQIITPTTSNQAISEGYHNGSGYAEGDANLVASNIKDGVNIFGVAGAVEQGAVVNSIQSGNKSLAGETTDQSINQIDISKSILFCTCTSVEKKGYDANIRADILNSTTLRFSAWDTANGEAQWFIVEFSSGVSVQHENTTITSSSKNITIDQVDLNNSVIIPRGAATESYEHIDEMLVSYRFSDSTTVVVEKGDDSYDCAVGFQVVEFD